MTAPTLTSRLIELAIDTYEPEASAAGARRALFDYLACLEWGRRRAHPALGDAGAAALGDRDDVHWETLTHPGAIVWTVVRASGVSGDAAWRAAHAGYETIVRLGSALGPDHRRLFHPTTTAGTVGAAVAAAVALDTDPVYAAGHAISVAGGSIVSVLERSGTRLLHRDHAVATGLACARAATLSATRLGLEHERGLLAAAGGDAERLLAERPRPAIADVAFRLHAATGFAHAAIEAAAELAPAPAAEQIVVEVPAGAVALAGAPDPRSDEDAWWSCQYAVVVTLLGLDLEDRSLVDDPRVRRLLGRVELRASDGMSRVTVDGRVAERRHPRGATDADLLAKWRTLNPEAPAPQGYLAGLDDPSPVL
jgi:2-methylcitrate dehydratase PrpD